MDEEIYPRKVGENLGALHRLALSRCFPHAPGLSQWCWAAHDNQAFDTTGSNRGA
jgi:hypothetical protein